MSTPVDAAMFLAALDETLTSVRAEAVRLFEDGVPADHCIRIAILVHDAKVIGRMTQPSAIIAPRALVSRH